MGCEGCHITGAGQNRALVDTIERAKEYAKKNQITVAVYKEGFDYFFKDAAAAATDGTPVIQFISPDY